MARGDNPTLHFVRGGRFECDGERTSPCHQYPACDCQTWDVPCDVDHPDVPHDECWMEPWINASDVEDSFSGGEGGWTGDEEMRDGPVNVEWEGDFCSWWYAPNDSRPLLITDLLPREVQG